MDTNISYDFITPQRIAFGWGRRREVGVLGRTLGRRALMVCGLPPEMATNRESPTVKDYLEDLL